MEQRDPSEPVRDVVEFDGRHGWSRRTWVTALSALAVVLTVGWVVEDRTRATSEKALAACTAQAEDALTRQEERFEFMADYLRPAMLALPAGGRDSLYALMSRTAAESAPRVATALDRCAGVRPAWFHPDLRSRRDAVVEHLATTLAVVEQIEADGERYYRDTPELDAQRRALFASSEG
jgi:uncharacterized membrane-anchored protein YhcB (DUF1043 family)